MSRKLKKREKKNVHLISHLNPKSPITEQYRLIRNNLHFSSVDKNIHSIVVTSPEPSDGKSTTSANLAIVLSQKGKKVLLVDVDLRKPTVHYAFNVSNIDGLTSVLTRDISLDQAIIKTSVPNLDVLTCGPIPPNPSELLDSKAMELVMEEVKGSYDYVVFDTPPLLVVTDAQILANKCDGVVMVVASGKTKRDRAMRAKELIEKANAHLLGVVVNGVESKHGTYYGEYS
ncbi:CpsD/CapB family tyrosine-protein kinase [Paenibacillus sp. BSR1-1]|uniref:CpsD/CapB family tyrosine-protein kinase n=1 Tax=Paenibacillus sp. BSR1-1 TaxID=3020845 RepID=UPI0025AF2548|nr:CpsD/CapB family tyrosine-protein kinase [Paenibacillus sp. BSR1-1]MDN3019268.1 CpsD/CapB family tyrosine-protein kinase [Paenibacillus sp. BSR1-1]